MKYCDGSQKCTGIRYFQLLTRVKGVEKLIIERLRKSFDELDRAIQTAKGTLTARASVPVEILDRIDSYEDILIKQRKFAIDLQSYIEKENWFEVTRHIQIINGLSGMIRDDAREILAFLRKVEPMEQRELMLS